MSPRLSSAVLLLACDACPAMAGEDEFAFFATARAAVDLADPVVQSALIAANAAHAALTEEEILALDTLWRDEIDATDKPTISGVTDAPAPAYQRQIVEGSQGAIAEVILMDDRGLNAGISSVTSDDWQGDEDKFLRTCAVGPTALHVGEVELDEFTGIYVTQLSVPELEAAGQLLGAATFSLDAAKL